MTIRYQAHCDNHPAREAIGLCVACRSALCSECITKIEGMNYCLPCLRKAEAAAASPLDARREIRTGAPLLLLAFTGCTVSFALAGFLLALLR